MGERDVTTLHGDTLLGLLSGLSPGERSSEVAKLIGLLLGEYMTLHGREGAAQLAYSLADHVVTGAANG